MRFPIKKNTIEAKQRADVLVIFYGKKTSVFLQLLILGGNVCHARDTQN